MIAYKFLDDGRVAPFSRVAWPEPGTWLDAGAVDLCRAGVHACRIADLPHWLGRELWQVELDGRVHESELMVVASRGRLTHRVAAWDKAAADAFGAACAAEARRRADRSPELEAFATDAEGAVSSSPAFAAFATARLAELQDGEAGYEAERARQAEWLAKRLDLA